MPVTKNKTKIVVFTFSAMICFFVIIDILFPFEPKLNYSKTIYDRNGKVLQSFLNNSEKWRLKLELNELNPMLEQAFLAKEDKYFYYHPGFNPLAIVRAFSNNIFQKKRTSGASTITMQVVRLLQPKERSYANKLLEIWRAMQLELHFSKKEILTLYFNLAPYGSNIEGIKSASIIYFQKNPDRLSLAEAATLCLIPNRPSSMRIGYKNEIIKKERNKLLNKFLFQKIFDKTLIETALLEPINAKRNAMPRLAPQFCEAIKKTENKENISSSIDASKQKISEEITKKYIQRLAGLNIHNAAVVLVHNQSKQVLAYVGSQDFTDNNYSGQVDGVRAIRSPGSTLKPLLYGLAFDQGSITPKHSILDVPTNFDGYEPENFDQDFHGKVSISYALANSLNIPAVKLLEQIGPYRMIESLKKCNFGTIQKKEKELGLSLILGGCGVNLLELAGLFSAFATDGLYSKLRFSKSSNSLVTTRIISPEANYLVTDILSQITRPDLPNNFNYTYHLPKIAWKTGTSFGKKDAWSIGYNQEYTIGVWAGNFDGTGVPEISGANIATPLLFEIFNTIANNQSANWYKEPQKLQKRVVCTESGKLPNAFCNNFTTDYYIPSISNAEKCDHLKKIYTNQSKTFSYCTSCMPLEGAVETWIPNIDPELLAYYLIKKIGYNKAIPHNPTCARRFSDNSIKITFPVHNTEYFMSRTEKQQLSLTCIFPPNTENIYWYGNDKFLGNFKPGQAFLFEPQPGKNKILCLDNFSHSHQIEFTVKWTD